MNMRQTRPIWETVGCCVEGIARAKQDAVTVTTIPKGYQYSAWNRCNCKVKDCL